MGVGIYENSALSAELCCEPTAALKINVWVFFK